MGEPLNVAWIWPIAADPATDARRDRAARRSWTRSRPAGRLTRLASAASHADRRAPHARARARDPRILGRSAPRPTPTRRAGGSPPCAPRRAPNRSSPARTSRSTCRASSVPASGRMLRSSSTQGSVALGNVLDTAARPAHRPTTTPLDAARSARLELRRSTALVVAPSALVAARAVARSSPPRSPFTLESGGRPVRAVQTDDGLEHLLEGDGAAGAPRRALPRRPRGRRDRAAEPDPRRRRRDAAALEPRARARSTRVLDGLADNPLLDAGHARPALRPGPAASRRRRCPVVRELAPLAAAPRRPSTPARYRPTRDNLDAFASIVGAERPAIVAGDRGPADLAHVGLARRRGPAAVASRAARRRSTHGIAAFTSLIQTPPVGLTVTLTSRKADLPLSFNNETGKTVRVRIQFESDKLVFPKGDGAGSLAPAAANTTSASRSRPARPGRSRCRSTVTSRGRQPARSARPRYTVRSTVVSGVGMFLTIGAGLFLAIWWITHWRRSRRRPDPARDARRRDRTHRRTGPSTGSSGPAPSSGSAPRSRAITGFLRVSALAALGLASPHRRLQHRELDAEHRLRAAARRHPHRDARPALRRALRARRPSARPTRSTPSRSRRSRRSRCSASSPRPGSSTSTCCGSSGAGKAAQQALATDLLRWFMPQMFFYGVTALATAMLNARRRFAAAAFAPVLNNVVVIAVLLALPGSRTSPRRSRASSRTRRSCVLLGLGTTAGIVAMALVLLPALRHAGARLCTGSGSGATPRSASSPASRAGRSATSRRTRSRSGSRSSSPTATAATRPSTSPRSRSSSSPTACSRSRS